MKTEFEIVFANIHHDEIREQIRKLGGICTQEKTLMRRAIFDNPATGKNSFVRVRDEGNRITTTYKQVGEKLDIHSVKEIDLEISSFEKMIDMYRIIGLRQKAYQETYRETWNINGEIELMLDIWPGIQPFIEIEGNSEEVVRKYTEIFGFDYNEGIFGCVDQLYVKELGIHPDILNNMEEITFDNPPVR